MRQQYCDSDGMPRALPVALWLHLVTLALILALCWTDMTSVLGKVRCTAVVVVLENCCTIFSKVCTFYRHKQMYVSMLSSCCGAPSLMTGWISNLLVQFAITLWSKSCKTRNHVLLSHLRLLGSVFVTSYDLQAYCAGILTCLHMALIDLFSLGCVRPNLRFSIHLHFAVLYNHCN
jgi:hypothetical protein